MGNPYEKGPRDAYFATEGNKFCCSKHFLSTDFKPSLTGHRRSLKLGAVPSVFPWTKVDEESLWRISVKNERLLHELQESKSKERIYKFGLEWFSGSSRHPNIFGCLDYPSLIEFWKSVECGACNLTYFSYCACQYWFDQLRKSVSLPGR